MAANPDYFLANQFYNQANPDIHYATTGPEIWEQVCGCQLPGGMWRRASMGKGG